MKKLLALSTAISLLASAAFAEAPTDLTSVNGSVLITTGNTLQTILTGVGNQTGGLRSLTTQNNNTSSDNCWIVFGDKANSGSSLGSQITPGTTTLSSTITLHGVSMTVQQAAILLAPGVPFQRYAPFIPGDTIYGTCATTGDSIHIDIQ